MVNPKQHNPSPILPEMSGMNHPQLLGIYLIIYHVPTWIQHIASLWKQVTKPVN